jgi:hypothetical protein
MFRLIRKFSRKVEDNINITPNKREFIDKLFVPTIPKKAQVEE